MANQEANLNAIRLRAHLKHEFRRNIAIHIAIFDEGEDGTSRVISCYAVAIIRTRIASMQ